VFGRDPSGDRRGFWNRGKANPATAFHYSGEEVGVTGMLAKLVGAGALVKGFCEKRLDVEEILMQVRGRQVN
jgi:hypothetical protein